MKSSIIARSAWAVLFVDGVLAQYTAKVDQMRTTALHTRQAADRNGHFRPQIHFSPPLNWLNDPNGLFLDSKGVWHLYYQYADSCSSPGLKHWGHATSPDLYAWTDKLVAITASDTLGSIFSGSTYVDRDNISGFFNGSAGDDAKDNVLAYYTSHTDTEQTQFLMYSLDGGETFENWEQGNPIIDLDKRDFRDPKVIFHPETKRFVMVLTLIDSVVFYTSSDLKGWTRTSTWTPDPQLGVIECPQLVPIPRRKSALDRTYMDSAHLLVLSVGNGGPGGVGIVKYLPGTFNGTVFTPHAATPQTFEFGPDVYATAFFHLQSEEYSRGEIDATSMSWATNIRYSLSTPTCAREGWRHAMTTAKTHFLDERYRLVGRMADLGATARAGLPKIADVRAVEAHTASYAELAAASNPAVEFNLTVHVPGGVAPSPAEGNTANLVFESTETAEQLVFSFSIDNNGSNNNDSNSSPPTATFTMKRSATLGWEDDAPGRVDEHRVSLAAIAMGGGGSAAHAFTLTGVLDRSIAEVYLNGGVEFGTLLYFANGTIDRIRLAQVPSVGGPLRFDLSVAPLRSSWGNGPP